MDRAGRYAEHLLARWRFQLEHVYADYDKSPYGSKYSGRVDHGRKASGILIAQNEVARHRLVTAIPTLVEFPASNGYTLKVINLQTKE
jgi:hypothetical protein